MNMIGYTLNFEIIFSHKTNVHFYVLYMMNIIEIQSKYRMLTNMIEIHESLPDVSNNIGIIMT